MRNTAIYDPHASQTPSQAQAANQRLARLRRIGSRARVDTPIVIRHPTIAAVLEMQVEPEPTPIDPEILFAAWVDRQRAKHAESLSRFELVKRADRPSIELIQKVVAEHHGFDWRIMFSAVRVASVVRPRQIAMYLSKTLTDRSLPDIGRRFGGRDHTTILHAVRKIAFLIETDLTLVGEINQLKSLIAARNT